MGSGQLAGLLLCPLQLYVGYGIFRKRRLALWLYYACCVIDVGNAVGSDQPISKILASLTIWLIPGIFYYPKRWHEFAPLPDKGRTVWSALDSEIPVARSQTPPDNEHSEAGHDAS